MAFQPIKIPSDYIPRHIIKECFSKDLPIHGGWGYRSGFDSLVGRELIILATSALL